MKYHFRKSRICNVMRCLTLIACILLASCTSTKVPLPDPTATEAPAADTAALDMANVFYSGEKDIFRMLSINLPEDEAEPYPTVLIFHGGAFEYGDRFVVEEFSQDLSKRGFAVVNANYRNGSYPTPVEDTFCALAWVLQEADTYKFDIKRIITVGVDVGGTLASLLGLVQDPAPYLEDCPNKAIQGNVVAGVVSYAGGYLLGAEEDHRGAEVTEVWDLFLRKGEDGYEERQRKASPINHIHADAPPFLLIHGLEDEWVDINHSERFVTALRADGVSVEFVELPDTGHDIQGGHLGEKDLDLIENFIRNLE